MAKDIVIEKDGVSDIYYNVEEIRTRSVDGGYDIWVPEDEVELGVKTITKNGEYKASSDNLYGYEKVIVTTSGAVIGKRNGKTYCFKLDEEGYIMERLLPDNIKITAPPNKMTYNSGETVNISGAVIKAFAGDDVWTSTEYPTGVIPLNELSISPAKVSVNKNTINLKWERPEDLEDLKAAYQIMINGS